jgi:hypothetical protein
MAVIEEIVVLLAPGQGFERHAESRIDPHFVAGAQLFLCEQFAAIDDRALLPGTATHPQPVSGEQGAYLYHRPRAVVAEFPHDDKSLV